jgi:hypothetical protein
MTTTRSIEFSHSPISAFQYFHFSAFPMMYLKPPDMGLLRELSPEISPEERSRLVLGDPPQALRPEAHPLAVMLRDRWKQRGCDRREAARAIGGEAGYAKTIRRIDELLAGDRYLPVWLERVCGYLEITQSDLDKAAADVVEWEKKIEAFHRMRNRHLAYARFGPYLMPLPPDHAEPLSTPVNREMRVEDLYEVHGDPSPEELASWLQERARHLINGKCPIAGWLYLRRPEEMHFFSAEGALIASGNADLPRPGDMVVPYVPLWRNQ